MTEYPAGTVAVATVRGVPNVRVMRMAQVHDRHVYLWVAAEVADEASTFRDRDVTDVRPLVVLDLANPGRVVEILREYAEGHGWAVLDNLADQIEAQTKPPRIPEPGLWGVVEAGYPTGEGRRYFCRMDTDSERWLGAAQWMRWEQLIDPTLVRPGIEDAS